MMRELEAIPAADVIKRPEGISLERMEQIIRAELEGRVFIKVAPVEDTCGTCRWFKRDEGTASGTCLRRTKRRKGGYDTGETLYVAQSRKACRGDYERRQDNA